MPTSRIFVSYVSAGDERGAEIANRLITDLRSNNVEIVTDDEHISNEDVIAFLRQELPRCQYFIFVQTPITLKSLRVQIAVNMAFQQQTPRILRLIAVPSEEKDVQGRWNSVSTFDASIDYARACARLLLELRLISLDESSPFLTAISYPPSEVPAPSPAPAPPPASLPGVAPLNENGLSPAPPASHPGFPPFNGNAVTPPASFPGLAPFNEGGPAPSAPPASLSGFPPFHENGLSPVTPASLPGFGPGPSGIQPPLPPPIQNTGQMNLYNGAAPAFPPLATPVYPPVAPVSSQPASLQRGGEFKISMFFSRPLKALQDRFSALSPSGMGRASMQVVLDDRPLPLRASRRTIILRASLVALALVLIAGATITLVRVRNHQTSGPNKQGATTPLAQLTSTPSAASATGTSTPRSFPTQGIVMVKPDPKSTVDVYVAGTTLALNDTLAGNDPKYQWQVSSTSGSSCQFADGVYDLTATSIRACLASKSNFSNAVYQVELRIVQGTTAGIVFRENTTNHTRYYFQITIDGHFSLWRSDGANIAPVQIPKTAAFASAINRGLGQPNVIAVSAIGSHIVCFINRTPVIDIHDTTYASGSVGVIAGQGKSAGTSEALFQYAKVWTLP